MKKQTVKAVPGAELLVTLLNQHDLDQLRDLCFRLGVPEPEFVRQSIMAHVTDCNEDSAVAQTFVEQAQASGRWLDHSKLFRECIAAAKQKNRERATEGIPLRPAVLKLPREQGARLAEAYGLTVQQGMDAVFHVAVRRYLIIREGRAS